MDPTRFDGLSRALAAHGPRRGVLGLLTAVPVVGRLLGILSSEEMEAAGRRKRRKTRNKRRSGSDKKNRKGKHKKRKPQCTPTTCAAQGKNCGSIADGCGTQIRCGPDDCGDGFSCTDHVCRCPNGDAVCQGVCCPAGEVCQNGDGACCTAQGQDAACAGQQCGTATDSCTGEVYSCTGCAGCCTGATCETGTTTTVCGRGGETCAGCGDGCCDGTSGACVAVGAACSGTDQVCAGGVCAACGGAGQPCCAGAACAAGLGCGGGGTAGVCGCGAVGGPCCAAGAACPIDGTCCNGRCVDTATDARNCGACGNGCVVNGTCAAGVCMCGSRPHNLTSSCCYDWRNGWGGSCTYPHFNVADTCEHVNECPTGYTPCASSQCAACCPAGTTCDLTVTASSDGGYCRQ